MSAQPDDHAYDNGHDQQRGEDVLIGPRTTIRRAAASRKSADLSEACTSARTLCGTLCGKSTTRGAVITGWAPGCLFPSKAGDESFATAEISGNSLSEPTPCASEYGPAAGAAPVAATEDAGRATAFLRTRRKESVPAIPENRRPGTSADF